MSTNTAQADETQHSPCKENLCGPFAEVLREAEEGDVIGFFCRLQPASADDGVMSFDGEYYFAAVLFASSAMKVLSRFYRGEPEWVEPIPGTRIEPIAGTTILMDDEHITLIDEDGKKIPCAKVGKSILLRGRLPKLPQEFFWSFNQ